MKKYSEVVFNGHPDKFCDLIADRIVLTVMASDPVAFVQIEASVWGEHIFLTGVLISRYDHQQDFRGIITALGIEIGYSAGSCIHAADYFIHDHIRHVKDTPEHWTDHVNDQCVITAYAGYDAKTAFLPPEHFAVWFLREQLTIDIQSGILKGHGPDGKVLIVMEEYPDEWIIRKVLVTMQQDGTVDHLKFLEDCGVAIRSALAVLIRLDNRWSNESLNAELLINPNGFFDQGGSQGDNGQTGRKLVMDFYGPSIPIGGGAIYGKGLHHIDRIASYAARAFALDMVAMGSEACMIRLCYAPGIPVPLDIQIESSVRPACHAGDYFNYHAMKERVNVADLDYDLRKLGTFYNSGLSFNRATMESIRNIA